MILVRGSSPLLELQTFGFTWFTRSRGRHGMDRKVVTSDTYEGGLQSHIHTGLMLLNARLERTVI